MPISSACSITWASWRLSSRSALRRSAAISPNDAANACTAPRAEPVEAGATYVFDKGYVHYGWWRNIHEKRAFFVTRPKTNMPLRKTKARAVVERAGDGVGEFERRARARPFHQHRRRQRGPRHRH